MITHTKVEIAIAEGDVRDMVVAQLADAGYEGFVEEQDSIEAYIPVAQFERDQLLEVLQTWGLDATIEEVEQKNWNELWEANIEPVIVEDFCTVRTHFHDIEVATAYEVVITPKMSFGTGHHATTQLMMLGMRHLHFAGSKVLDFGTGTGVLAILARKLGAADVMAIDNDEWSVNNAQENVAINGVDNVTVGDADISILEDGVYDILLANINRHILLAYMSKMYALVKVGGVLLMSGLLVDDEAIITNAANEAGFSNAQVTNRNGWISILVQK